MDTSKELPTLISFCTGYGGIERGLDLAGVKHRVVAYVEIEAFAIANLVAKMEAGKLHPAPIWTDLKTFPAHLFRDKTTIITGGYPCQPFSAAGKRQGADDPRHLWPYIRQHIQTIRPERTFFENVEGHISLGLSTVISDMEEDDFRTAYGLFSAEEVGAPHRRKRVFIMANTNSERLQRPEGLRGPEAQREPIRHAAQHYAKSAYRWPARPNEPQQSWEPSRVKPRVGRVSDGYSSRVDRLRLLGNGVVPQTAALAWELLAKRFDNE